MSDTMDKMEDDIDMKLIKMITSEMGIQQIIDRFCTDETHELYVDCCIYRMLKGVEK